MFLSKALLNLSSEDVRTDLDNCQKMHCRLMSLFGRCPNGQPARDFFEVLYRLENTITGEKYILIQSRDLPDWTSLPNGYLGQSNGTANPLTKVTPEDHFKNGMTLRFKLQANPTRRDIITKKWINYKTLEECLSWLLKKGEDHGFKVLENTVAIDRTTVSGEKCGEQKMFFNSAVFEGVLHITDAIVFKKAYIEGVGKGRAYGHGLISVARA